MEGDLVVSLSVLFWPCIWRTFAFAGGFQLKEGLPEYRSLYQAQDSLRKKKTWLYQANIHRWDANLPLTVPIGVISPSLHKYKCLFEKELWSIVQLCLNNTSLQERKRVIKEKVLPKQTITTDQQCACLHYQSLDLYCVSVELYLSSCIYSSWQASAELFS